MPNRPCWVEISTRSLEENFQFLTALTGKDADLLAIVKADAYGHSLGICAPAAVRAGAKWLGVTSVEEGVAARALCPDVRILVIAGVFPGQGAALLANRLTAVVWERWQLDEIEKAARDVDAKAASIPVHLEIDTGMSRQGASPKEFEAILGRIGYLSPLRVEGLMTHLYAADESDGVVTRGQLAQMKLVLRRIYAAGHCPKILNVGNSAAVLSGLSNSIEMLAIGTLAREHSMLALMRPGLALYGLAPRFQSEEPSNVAETRARLKPVLAWKSRVVSVRQVPVGTTVGYNGTFVATEPMRLALIAAGYGDGLDRSLGNRFSLLVRGERAPLVGRISMDQSVLDITEIQGVETGDEVVIIGAQGGETITAFDHAEATGTIPWEVFTRINARVKRVEV